MDIFFRPKFEKRFKKLSREIQKLVEERIKIFINDPFDSRLKTHKLHGKFEEYFSFSINNKYRIIFYYTENDKDVKFYSIGTHDIYE
ncbi:MAG: type II toxin-antitoxin system mRNA interferase toxin, RelE/StbE family [bacterium]|nr:type II toxin-antitoxin system mRNA interferase toxin, RelE/StbE family [bacterium]